MKALNLQLKIKPLNRLEAIVIIECGKREDCPTKMKETHSDIVNRLISYKGKQEQRDVKTTVDGKTTFDVKKTFYDTPACYVKKTFYDIPAFYVKISGPPDYIWFILRTVMERPEFRFSTPYGDYLQSGVHKKCLPQSVLADYKSDLARYMELEDEKKKAVAEQRFEDAVPLRDRQIEMRKKVYVTE
ncbi:UvrB/UvrC motif-containing protein [Candidatus Woesearchaeota archaeon]|nr:UvrB/UvrC motif-containing protein [Candidatus Woesearchaeota archaeon]